jgi:hypothetical protein
VRAFVVAMCLLATSAVAEDAPPALAVAPAGECAGEERELAQPFLPKAASKDEAVPLATGASGLGLLSPTQVAASGALAGVPPPTAPSFAGPGACDTPGSGCVTEIVDDPDPGSGCGFPGSPCP